MGKADQEKRIRELEAKIKRLEEEGRGEETGGIAGGLLREVGAIFGLGTLIKRLEKSPAFQERLKRIDEEAEARLRERPLKRAERRPFVEGGVTFRTLAEEPAVKVRKEAYKPRREAPKEREVPVDIFEEKDYLLVIAELPGVAEKDINIDLVGDKLTISADTARRKYYKRVILPCPTHADWQTAYKNGVLEIRLEKSHD